MIPWARRRGTLAAAALALLAGWELLVLARAHSGAPTDDDYRAAAAAVTAERQAGDLVVFAPRWSDPLARAAFGALVTVDDLARMDEASYARIWEISIREAAAPETIGVGQPDFQRRFGAVRVRRFARHAERIVWRFHEGAEVKEVAHTPRRCHVVRGRREATVPTLGTRLVVRAGLADVWARKENHAFALLRVLVDGEERARAVIGNDSGFVRLPEIAVPPGPHRVTFLQEVAQAPGDPTRARLELCIAAEGRE